MKTKESSYHIGIAPTSRARCRRCKCQVQKGSARIVTTALVQHGHTVRFTRCITCIDAPLAAAIVRVYGSLARIPSTLDVNSDTADAIRATVAARLADGATPSQSPVMRLPHNRSASPTNRVATKM